MPTLYDNFERVRQYIDAHQGGSVDLSAYVSKVELSAQSYLTAVPSEYITQDELSANSYLTAVPSEYPTYAAIYAMGYITSGDVAQMSYITMGDVSACGYITSIPSEYITEGEISQMGYITQDELSANSYLTQHQDLTSYLLAPIVSGYTGQMKFYNDGFLEVTSNGNLRAKTFSYNQLNVWSPYTLINRASLKNFVNGRLADIESTYATISQIPVINENIIPKETNTYTLGDSSYIYSATYTNNLYLDEWNGGLRKVNQYTFGVYVNNLERMRFGGGGFWPTNNKGRTCGTNDNWWLSTYTSNIYADNAYISNYNNLIWTGTSAEYALLDNYTTYQLYLIQEA